MKKLAVHYCGWGEDWPLGMLADDGRALLFEYSPEALVQQFELSPLRLKLRAVAYGDFPDFQLGFPIRRATRQMMSRELDRSRRRLMEGQGVNHWR